MGHALAAVAAETPARLGAGGRNVTGATLVAGGNGASPTERGGTRGEVRAATGAIAGGLGAIAGPVGGRSGAAAGAGIMSLPGAAGAGAAAGGSEVESGGNGAGAGFCATRVGTRDEGTLVAEARVVV